MSSPVFFPSTDKEKTPSFRLLAQLSPSVFRKHRVARFPFVGQTPLFVEAMEEERSRGWQKPPLF